MLLHGHVGLRLSDCKTLRASLCLTVLMRLGLAKLLHVEVILPDCKTVRLHDC